jgi:pantetheine-phosphate adenylyltransferase
MHAIYPGSFDPPTIGHLSIIEKAVKLFDRITVVIAVNPDKNSFLKTEDRKSLLQKLCNEYKNVNVIDFNGLIVDCVKEVGADVIIKGLRNNGDLSHEQIMAETNRKLSGVETLFLPCEGKFQYISSSLVRQVFNMGGPIEQFVPMDVSEFLVKK